MLKYGIALSPLAIMIVLVLVAVMVMVIAGEESPVFKAVGGLAGAWLFGGPILSFVLLSAMILHDLFQAAQKRMDRKSMGRDRRD